MAEVVLEPEQTTIPGWVVDLASFIRWAESTDFPTEGRYSFLRGQVWVDSGMAQLITHNRLKVRITRALDTLAVALVLGYVFGDRTRLRNATADLSVEPDVMFVAYDSRRACRAALTEYGPDGHLLVDASPDLVVEVVRDSSVRKDTVELRSANFDAGIREYCLVDARGEQLVFDVLRRGPKKFVETKAQTGGWLKSIVFGRSFRIVQSADPFGDPQYTLEHRP